ncbi:hypothetical protein HGM15179_008289 [Zosterops borbonicus]|uniref:Uncharacterized protein n=1 Tax=Zosterops borbonicus TaxID=364589 RepID=A0A8K1GJU8_9PASS|nr:hypothetical protein HGM15179_008289 [Zosterops borbonicus]
MRHCLGNGRQKSQAQWEPQECDAAMGTGISMREKQTVLLSGFVVMQYSGPGQERLLSAAANPTSKTPLLMFPSVRVQDIPLDDLGPEEGNLSPGQGDVELVQGVWRPWHRAQENTGFDFNPWERLPTQREELQTTRK